MLRPDKPDGGGKGLASRILLLFDPNGRVRKTLEGIIDVSGVFDSPKRSTLT